MATSKFYVPLFVSTMDDGRLLRAGPDAELLWYRALQLAKRTETDGVLELMHLLKISPRGKRATVEALVRVDLLRPIGDDQYQVAGWLDWNQSKEDAEAKRRKDRDRKRHLDSVRNPNGSQTDSRAQSKAIQSEAEAVLSEGGFSFAALFAAVLAACGWADSEMNPEKRATAERATAALALRGATPDNVPVRAARWKGDYRLTPESLDRNWPSLGDGPVAVVAHGTMGLVALARNRANVAGYERDAFASEISTEPVDLVAEALDEFDRLRNPPIRADLRSVK